MNRFILTSLGISPVFSRICADSFSSCEDYSASECRYNSYIPRHCPKTCGKCENWSSYLKMLEQQISPMEKYFSHNDYDPDYMDVYDYNYNDKTFDYGFDSSGDYTDGSGDYYDYEKFLENAIVQLEQQKLEEQKTTGKSIDDIDVKSILNYENSCSNTAGDAFCSKYAEYCHLQDVIAACEKTCVKCDKRPLCEKDDKDEEWCNKHLHFCYIEFVHEECPRACGLCRSVTETSTSTSTTTTTSTTTSTTRIPMTSAEFHDSTVELYYLEQRVCGEILIPENRPASKASYGHHPWTIHIKVQEFSNCGGAIINENWVVTAAHCVVGEMIEDVKLIAGDYSMDQDRFEQIRDVSKMVKHADYRPDSDLHNVALLKTDQPFELTSHVQPVCLPPYKRPVKNSQKCKISGWTDAMLVRDTKVLQDTYVNIISDEKCQNYHKESVLKDIFCAEIDNENKDQCRGEAGGPLVCENQISNKNVLIGVTSWGQGCSDSSGPAGFTDIAQYVYWISSQTEIKMLKKRKTIKFSEF